MKALTKIAAMLAFCGAATVSADSGTVGAAIGSPPQEHEVSIAEMQSTMTKLDAQMKADLEAVMQAKEIAKKQKDVIKLNCVNDGLVQIKGQLNIADSQSAQLQVAIGNKSDNRQTLFHEYQDTAASVKTLRGGTDSCIGTPDMVKQESGSTVESPPIPDDPAYTPPLGEEYEPPGYASPFN